ncbi:MAG: hypothetical protein ACUVXA_05870, partial [Candidatus Jordarchaeum sp.]
SRVPSAKDIDDLTEAMRVTLSKTAEGMVRKETKNASVKLGDGINVALNKMISLELVDVPIVDDKGKVVGDLQLSEILKVILEKGIK